MKDGRTHLAHKAEHAVDLETGAIVGITVQGADQGDTTTIADTLTAAAEDLEAVATVTDDHTVVIDEVVADKGYHSNQVLTDLAASTCGATSRNRSRPTQLDEEGRGPRRGLCESPTHPRGTGRGLAAATERAPRTAERASVRHRRHATDAPARACQHPQTTARHTGACNLGLLMRTLIGVGTPRGLQGRVAAVLALVLALWTRFSDLWRDRETPSADHASAFTPHHRFQLLPVRASQWAV